MSCIKEHLLLIQQKQIPHANIWSEKIIPTHKHGTKLSVESR